MECSVCDGIKKTNYLTSKPANQLQSSLTIDLTSIKENKVFVVNSPVLIPVQDFERPHNNWRRMGDMLSKYVEQENTSLQRNDIYSVPMNDNLSPCITPPIPIVQTDAKKRPSNATTLNLFLPSLLPPKSPTILKMELTPPPTLPLKQSSIIVVTPSTPSRPLNALKLDDKLRNASWDVAMNVFRLKSPRQSKFLIKKFFLIK